MDKVYGEYIGQYNISTFFEGAPWFSFYLLQRVNFKDDGTRVDLPNPGCYENFEQWNDACNELVNSSEIEVERLTDQFIDDNREALELAYLYRCAYGQSPDPIKEDGWIRNTIKIKDES